MKMIVFLLVFALLAQNLPSTNAKHLDGVINSGQDFVFLTRFVFQPNEYGEMDYTFTYPTTECCYQMLIFNDEPKQWPYIREHEDQLDCFDRKELIPSYYNGKVTLSTSQNCEMRINDNTGQEEFYCHGKRHFDVTKERWWYIAIAHCGGDGINNFKYNIDLYNGKSVFDRHFSADERYILQTDIAFLWFYLCICGCLLIFRKKMFKHRMISRTYQLFCYSCYLQTISLLFQTIALGTYANNGVGIEPLRKFGEIVSSTSTLLFVLLLILIAKGYTVTRARLRPITSLKIAIFTCFYFFAYFGLYAMQELIYDPRDVVNKYDSFAGLGIVVMHFIGLVWMYYACFFTIKHYRAKAVLYISFIIIFTLWFIASPITIWMSNEFLAKWKRAKIINGLEMAVMFYGHMVFLLMMTRPSVTNQYFPFHRKVNTVGIMDDGDATACDEEKRDPPMFASLFNTSQAKYVIDSESQETVYESPVVPINFNRHTSNEDVAMDNLSSTGKEADLFPKVRFILVKEYVEDN